MCRGDSGGSLYVVHEPGIDTVEAIVSGGVGLCGKGYPRWWIKVSAYRDWILCIMDGINEGKTKDVIERFCTFKWKVESQGKFGMKNDIFPK